MWDGGNEVENTEGGEPEPVLADEQRAARNAEPEGNQDKGSGDDADHAFDAHWVRLLVGYQVLSVVSALPVAVRD